MKALLQAELLKLRSTRMTVGLLLAALGLVALTVVVTVPDVGAENAPFTLGDPDLLADTVATRTTRPATSAKANSSSTAWITWSSTPCTWAMVADTSMAVILGNRDASRLSKAAVAVVGALKALM